MLPGHLLQQVHSVLWEGRTVTTYAGPQPRLPLAFKAYVCVRVCVCMCVFRGCEIQPTVCPFAEDKDIPVALLHLISGIPRDSWSGHVHTGPANSTAGFLSCRVRGMGLKTGVFRGTWVAQLVKRPTLDIGSCHDLTVCEIEPRIGLCTDSIGFCLPLSLSLPHPLLAYSLSLSLSLSLSQNK